MKKFLCLSLLLVFTLKILGQSTYKAGYIVIPSGDTLRGYLQNDSETGKSFRYKTLDAEIDTSYYPNQIIACGFEEGKAYQSISILENKQIKFIFAQLFLKGELSLLKNGFDFYIKTRAGSTYALRQSKKDVSERGGRQAKKYDPEYKRTLKLIMKGCKNFSLFQKVDNITLNKTDFILLLQEYHQCISAPFQGMRQETYELGYVVNLSGDTLRGFISDRSSNGGERICQFKTQEYGILSLYNPKQILAYKKEGGSVYKSVKDHEFKRILKLLMKDCEDFAMLDGIDQTMISESSLMQILQNYNSCTPND